jgi:HD-GYP domain-containing protein (c-di-GMP phosphodiesterase class II)
VSVPAPFRGFTYNAFLEIKRNPGSGRDLLTELGGFPPSVLDLVESHHERRILTVADVYDALTADRVYREARSSESCVLEGFSWDGA